MHAQILMPIVVFLGFLCLMTLIIRSELYNGAKRNATIIFLLLMVPFLCSLFVAIKSALIPWQWEILEHRVHIQDNIAWAVPECSSHFLMEDGAVRVSDFCRNFEDGEIVYIRTYKQGPYFHVYYNKPIELVERIYHEGMMVDENDRQMTQDEIEAEMFKDMGVTKEEFYASENQLNDNPFVGEKDE